MANPIVPLALTRLVVTGPVRRGRLNGVVERPRRLLSGLGEVGNRFERRYLPDLLVRAARGCSRRTHASICGLRLGDGREDLAVEELALQRLVEALDLPCRRR